jgi:hypothetical protein
MRTLSAVGSLLLLLPLATLSTSPLLADDVYLKNGRSFEGVVAEVGDSQVRIQMPGGSISLPRSSVDRVEKAETRFSEYLQRKEAIEAREAQAAADAAGKTGRSAADWLELARWARRNGFSRGAREAGLTAAEIDPRLPGLASVLRPFGYVYEERLDRWVSYDESMQMHGFVRDHGQWISPEEARARGEQQLQLQTAMAAQQAAAAATEARDMAMLSAQVGLGQPMVPGGGVYDSGYGPGDAYGYYGGGLGWPYSSPVFGVGGFGFGSSVFGTRGSRGFEQHGRGFHHGQGAGMPRPPARVIAPGHTTGFIRR